MGLFDWLFKKKETAPAAPADTSALLENVEVATGVVLPRALAAQWDEIEQWKVSSIQIKATPGDGLTVHQSSFGAYPCLPKYFPYPVDAENKYMYPLAQINCNDLPPLANYPSNGYLQFYISTNDVYGCSFDDLRDQSNFRVLYFSNEVVAECKTDFSFLKNAFAGENTPVNKPHHLTFTPTNEFFGMGDAEFEEERLPQLDAIIDRYPLVAKELEDFIWNNFESNGHKMGGYAFFTQSDPRHDVNEDYILLLQIDSDKEILWGDVGVANFFIHPDDLAKKDFSKVMYSWDCS